MIKFYETVRKTEMRVNSRFGEITKWGFSEWKIDHVLLWLLCRDFKVSSILVYFGVQYLGPN